MTIFESNFSSSFGSFLLWNVSSFFLGYFTYSLISDTDIRQKLVDIKITTNRLYTKTGHIEKLLEENALKSQKRNIPEENIYDLHQSSDKPMYNRPSFSTTSKKGYLTNQDLEDRRVQKLTAEEECDVLNRFMWLQDTNYLDSISVVRDSDYDLKPMIVNGVSTFEKDSVDDVYHPKVIGVKIFDPLFDPTTKEVSEEGRIIDIVNIGGKKD